MPDVYRGVFIYTSFKRQPLVDCLFVTLLFVKLLFEEKWLFSDGTL